MTLIMAGVLVVQVLLVGSFLSTAKPGSRRREVVGSLLAVLLVAMWVAVLALGSVTLYAAHQR